MLKVLVILFVIIFAFACIYNIIICQLPEPEKPEGIVTFHPNGGGTINTYKIDEFIMPDICKDIIKSNFQKGVEIGKAFGIDNVDIKDSQDNKK